MWVLWDVEPHYASLVYAIVAVYILRYSHKKYMYDQVSSVFFLEPFVGLTVAYFYESKLLYPQMGYLRKISFRGNVVWR